MNNFIKFERKLYQVFSLQLGRPLRLKAVLYFIMFGLVELAIYFTPVIGRLINWLPIGILIVLPVLLAWLLADVGTENRSPLYFFRSLFSYHKRKINGSTLFRGREVDKNRNYQFRNYFTFSNSHDVEPIDSIVYSTTSDFANSVPIPSTPSTTDGVTAEEKEWNVVPNNEISRSGNKKKKKEKRVKPKAVPIKSEKGEEEKYNPRKANEDKDLTNPKTEKKEGENKRKKGNKNNKWLVPAILAFLLVGAVYGYKVYFVDNNMKLADKNKDEEMIFEDNGKEKDKDKDILNVEDVDLNEWVQEQLDSEAEEKNKSVSSSEESHISQSTSTDIASNNVTSNKTTSNSRSNSESKPTITTKNKSNAPNFINTPSVVRPDKVTEKPEEKVKPSTSTNKPTIKPEVKPETKPEQKSDEEVKPETKPEQKPEVKPETKPEQKPEVKPVLKPMADMFGEMGNSGKVFDSMVEAWVWANQNFEELSVEHGYVDWDIRVMFYVNPEALSEGFMKYTVDFFKEVQEEADRPYLVSVDATDFLVDSKLGKIANDGTLYRSRKVANESSEAVKNKWKEEGFNELLVRKVLMNDGSYRYTHDLYENKPEKVVGNAGVIFETENESLMWVLENWHEWITKGYTSFSIYPMYADSKGFTIQFDKN